MNTSQEAVSSFVEKRVGFAPRDAFGWLYACRGLYKLGEYGLVVDGLTHCLRNEKTRKDAQHLLAFSLLKTDRHEAAANAFYKSVELGNQTDWQPLVELCIEYPDIMFILKKK
eukprot:219845_1